MRDRQKDRIEKEENNKSVSWQPVQSSNHSGIKHETIAAGGYESEAYCDQRGDEKGIESGLFSRIEKGGVAEDLKSHWRSLKEHLKK